MAPTEHMAAALRYLESGCWQQAEDVARAALTADSANIHAAHVAGLAMAAAGEPDRAAPILNSVAGARPDAPHPCQDLAKLTPALPGPLLERQFRACLYLAPNDVRLRRSFASWLLDADEPEAAESVLQDMQGDAVAHHLKGTARAERGRFGLAASSFKLAVALNPAAAASWSNLGMMLKTEGQFQAAIRAHGHAVTLEPSNPRFRVNRAVALLKAGEWERAWPDYEYRLELAEAPQFDKSRLLATGTDLKGRTVLALHEDGFGDTLQFLRYLPLLAEQGARVIACVPAPLIRLMRMVPGVAAVVSGGAMPDHDFVCPMFSLPRIFGSTVETIPPVPALACDTWPGIEGGIGLVWAGQARPSAPGFRSLDRRRSAGLAAFAPLAEIKGVRFVSLQAGPAARQARPDGLELLDPMAEVTDFLDTARIIAGLDAVVSVDTSVVHLAGLLGKPVFMLDRYDGCWRWLHGRSDSPWYPEMRIFRQDEPGDWSAPMARVVAALQSRTAILTEAA